MIHSFYGFKKSLTVFTRSNENSDNFSRSLYYDSDHILSSWTLRFLSIVCGKVVTYGIFMLHLSPFQPKPLCDSEYIEERKSILGQLGGIAGCVLHLHFQIKLFFLINSSP